MKKGILASILVFALILICATAFGDIQENFAAGGIIISGSGSVTANGNNLLDPSNQKYDFSFYLAPSFSFMVIDNLSLNVTPSGYYSLDLSGSQSSSSGNGLGVFTSAIYYFILDPKNPLVPSIGAGIGFQAGSGGSFYAMDGTVTTSKALRITTSLNLPLACDYFITDRIALDLHITPRVNLPIQLSDFNGNAIPIPSQIQNLLTFTCDVSVGISFFFPVKEKALITF
jgi:hypothetical protein